MQRCSAVGAPSLAADLPAVADVPVEAARWPAINQAADLNTILEERDACGVSGLILCRNVMHVQHPHCSLLYVTL